MKKKLKYYFSTMLILINTTTVSAQETYKIAELQKMVEAQVKDIESKSPDFNNLSNIDKLKKLNEAGALLNLMENILLRATKESDEKIKILLDAEEIAMLSALGTGLSASIISVFHYMSNMSSINPMDRGNAIANMSIGKKVIMNTLKYLTVGLVVTSVVAGHYVELNSEEHNELKELINVLKVHITTLAANITLKHKIGRSSSN